MHECLPVAQTVQDGASNAYFIGLTPRKAMTDKKFVH